MNVIGFKIIRDFIKLHSDAASALNAWYRMASSVNWKSIVEVRQTYPYADAVGACTIFNIKGNHYRLIVIIDYRAQIISIKNILTHAEYDKEKWKKACGR
ncbi:MAG TPA: type II toxin-antitoxin system HigB family toxin [Pyrinomonadaceae bacterium]|jgi:mRNA interferase HigB|nr:type II toxin-antitoxin system HigB family toxin [Pyrinomonadaceae bacterium]